MGSDDEKKSFIIHLREKRVKQNIISMYSHPKFILRLFLKKVKKMICIKNRKYTLFEGPAENLSPPTLSQI